MDQRIQQAITLLHAQFAGPIPVDDVARAVNLPPSRFAHLFRKEVGVSPTRYIRALRMICASLLLERTSLSVKEVMVRVGCNDPSHFTRDFCRVLGRTPSEWRRRTRRRTDDTEDATSLDIRLIAALANRKQNPPTQ